MTDEPRGCICQDQQRRGYCTEPGCPYASDRAARIAKEPNPALSQERLAEQRDLAWTIELVILRRLRENKIDGYTKEMSEEIAGLATTSLTLARQST